MPGFRLTLLSGAASFHVGSLRGPSTKASNVPGLFAQILSKGRRGISQYPKPTCFRGRGLVLEGGLRRAPNELYSSGFDFEADEEDNGCSEACREGEEKEKKKVKKRHEYFF